MMEVKIMIISGNTVNHLDAKNVSFLCASNIQCFALGGSVQFSRSVLSDSLQSHGLQHAGFPVHHQLLELAQTHGHQVGDAIQSSNPLLSSSPLAFNLPQHQDLFQLVSSSHQVAKVLEFQLQHQSFRGIVRTDL